MGISVRKSYVDGPFGQVHLRLAEPASADHHPPLLCFHMSPNSGVIYEAWIEEMGRDRTTIAPDTPGFGMSDPPPTRPGIEDYARAMIQVIDSLGRAPVDLMGYHTGSMIAVEVAKQASHLVRKIVMVSAPVFTDDELEDFRTLYGPWSPDEDGRFLAEKWKANRFWEMDGITPEMTAAKFADAIRRPQISWWGHAAAFDYDLRSVLPALAHPALVLAPEDDLVAHTRRGSALMADPQIRELAGWGHGFLDLHTAEAAGIVREFLDGA